jgi:hypothetical protein
MGRTGIVTSISNWQIHGVELDPASGSYLVVAQYAPHVALVSKAGSVVTLTQSIPAPSAARFAQDGTAWITGNARPARMYRIDMQGTVIQTVGVPVPAVRVVGVEIYGSRRLVCNGSGRPGTTVLVSLSSRKAGDQGLPYLLAASLSRRPGLRMPNGERLNLAPDALFTVSVLGLVPAVFQGFQGVTSASGRALARVAIPASFPGGSKITVFVAGVIYGPRGVQTATNTHWIVLE